MTPYYSDDSVTLYHGDCLEVDEWLAAGVLVTDPPYGLDADISAGFTSSTRHRQFHTRVNDKPNWDRDLKARDAALERWGSKPFAVFASPLKSDQAPPHREFPLIWSKGASPGMGDTTFPWGRSYELIYVNGPGWTGRRESSVIEVVHASGHAKREGHPSTKPVALMQRIIAKAPPGVITDPFAGSGATLVAAKQLGRRAIGVELEERYCELTAKRLAQDVLDFEGLGA